MAIAFAAVLSLSSCDNNDHECTYDDHSADLVGTWTCLTANFAESLVISADGKVVSTGVGEGEYWEDVNGTVAVNEGKITLTFEDGDNFEGHFDIIPGVAFSLYNEEAGRLVFNYCKEDLADEIVGMWVSTQTDDMLIQTFNDNGTSVITGYLPEIEDFVTNASANTYKVVGDLVIIKKDDTTSAEGASPYMAMKMVYSPNGTSLGDIMTLTQYIPAGNEFVELTASWLRIKQSLDLANKQYDYSKTYITNAKGLDQDIEVMGITFNFNEMDGTIMDKMLKNLLFSVQFPDANTIEYCCYLNGKKEVLSMPIVVEGNKMTIKMSSRHAAYRDIDLYSFQDADGCQFHMYMPTYAFENFFTNISIAILSAQGELNLDDKEAVDEIYEGVSNAIETINVSLVMKSNE